MKDLINRKDLHDRFIALMEKNPVSYRQIMQEAKLSQLAVKNFFNMAPRMHMKTLLKMQNWITKKELEVNGPPQGD